MANGQNVSSCDPLKAYSQISYEGHSQKCRVFSGVCIFPCITCKCKIRMNGNFGTISWKHLIYFIKGCCYDHWLFL